MRLPGPDAFLKFAVLAAIMAWMAGCEGTETTNPRGSEVEAEYSLRGRLVNSAGIPVAGAVVRIFRTEASPLGEALPKTSVGEATAVTNAKGAYSFKDVPGGQYNLIGEYNYGGLVVLIPQVEYEGGKTSQDLGTDTLRLPGRIRGSAMFDGAGREGIFCYLTGSPFLSISDETGEFWILGVPQGSYRLNYAFPGLQTVQDTGIVVKAGRLTTMPPRELVHDTAYPPPAPASLRSEYDTLSGVAELSWSPPRVPDLDGYAVYRIGPVTPFPQRLNPALLRDTVFRDTLFRSFDDDSTLVVSYQVKSQDLSGSLSTGFSPPILVHGIAPGKVRTRFSLSLGTASGDTAVPGDTVRVFAFYENPTRQHARIAWRYSGSTTLLRERIAALPRYGTDTLVLPSLQPGAFTVLVEAEDAAGSVWRDSLAFPVLRSRPAARSGRDP